MNRYTAAALCALTLSACEKLPPTSATIEQAQTEDNQQRLIKAIPAPRLATSGERLNLAKRLQRLNTENMSGYVYLLNYGTVVAFYPIKGKVTSLNAFLSGDQKPAYFGQSATQGTNTTWAGWQMVESPDYDGAYGKNSDGIFFFTSDTDAYVEWHGDYLFSDQPLKLSQQPVMIRDITGK